MPLKWELVSPGLACFHGNLEEVNELLLLITLEISGIKTAVDGEPIIY